MERTRTRDEPRGSADDVADELGLTIVDHPDSSVVGARRALPDGASLLLGRTDEACLAGAFEDGLVSRRHARVWREGDVVRVEDLQSRNGTWLDGARLTREAQVKEGAIIGVGDVLLMLLRAPLAHAPPEHPEMVGVGAALGRTLRALRRAAPRDTTVLLLGEMGTGKELAARALHRWSGRDGPLVPVNCAGIHESLLSTELFGHARGAFTDAKQARAGLVGLARGGTLFLDEVADAPASVQAALLRLLEVGRYRPVGADLEVDADVRVVVGAQPRLLEAVEAGRFRADLWSRIARAVVEIPPLSARREDIPCLARHFATAYAGRPMRLAPELVIALLQRAWPGHVRELSAAIERGVIALDGDDVLPLGPWLTAVRQPSVAGSAPGPIAREAADADRPTRRPPTPRPAAENLEAALGRADGNVAAAARSLGVGRKTFYRWCEAEGVDPRRTLGRSV